LFWSVVWWGVGGGFQNTTPQRKRRKLKNGKDGKTLQLKWGGPKKNGSKQNRKEKTTGRKKGNSTSIGSEMQGEGSRTGVVTKTKESSHKWTKKKISKKELKTRNVWNPALGGARKAGGNPPGQHGKKKGGKDGAKGTVAEEKGRKSLREREAKRC